MTTSVCLTEEEETGRKRMGRSDYKWNKETFGDDGYVHYLDCINGFMS